MCVGSRKKRETTGLPVDPTPVPLAVCFSETFLSDMSELDNNQHLEERGKFGVSFTLISVKFERVIFF